MTKTKKYAQEKAIPDSCGKNAFTLLKRNEADKIEKMDPFNNR